ncbi:oligosaccharide biosynthesis protein Alg14-like protein, partial [Spinellus fusiger]
KRRPNGKQCKTVIVLGSGSGHTAEMLHLIQGLDKHNYSPRLYLMSEGDCLSAEKVLQWEKDATDYTLHTLPRARRVGQCYWTVPWSVLRALFGSLPWVLLSRPELILCNGPGQCVPICMLAYLPRLAGLPFAQLFYVESFARVSSLSLTGKLLSPFVDRFLVQWPQL